MSDKYDFHGLSNKSIKLAETLSANLKCAEIFYENSEYLNIDVEENFVKNCEMGSDRGISIRAIDNRGSLGFSFTDNLEMKSIEKMVKIAIKMMEAGTEDPEFKNLPRKYEKYHEVKGLFDKNLKEMNIEDSVCFVKDLIDVCDKDDLAITQTANFRSDYSKSYILNSNGLEATGKETSCMIYSDIVVKDKIRNETSSGSDWQAERNLKNINAEEIAKNALNNAKRYLNRVKIKNMNVPLILTPKGVISFILNPISQAINGDTFQYNRSFLIGKRGELIGSKLLNIEDDALIDGATGSCYFDGEGVPCKNKKIVENGLFLKNGLLHNSYTASKEGIESTGNASRSSYSSIPNIGTTNFMMKPGDFSKEEMIKDVKEGIILDNTGDNPNITTGDFSGLIMQGNLIKNGEIKDPLNETMFAVNLLDLFKNVEAVSNNVKIYGSYRAPYVKIKKVQIIGGAR